MSGWMELKHRRQLKQHQPASSLISYLVKLTMSTSTYKKIFFKPGTSTDTSGDIPNVSPDATETPDSAETTSSPGQNVCFGFHSVSCVNPNIRTSYQHASSLHIIPQSSSTGAVLWALSNSEWKRVGNMGFQLSK